MTKKTNKLSNIINVPSPDPTNAHRRRLLNIMLLSTATAALLSLAALLITAPMGLAGEQGEVRILGLSVALALFGTAVIYALNRYVSGELASALFVLLSIAIAALSDEPREVVDGRGLLVFTIPILAASALLRPWASFVAAGLSGLTIIVVGLEVPGHFPNVPAIVALFIVALVAWLSARSLEHALENSRVSSEALRESEERFRVALKGSPIVVWNQDKELRHTWIYDPHPGLKTEETIGKTDEQLLPPDDAAHLTEIKRGVLESGVAAREEVRTTIAGETFFYDLTVEPLRDLAGDIVGIACASMDITERKRAEEALRKSERKYRRFFQASKDCTFFTSQDGRWLDMNQAAVSLFGYEGKEELREISIPDLYADPADREEHIRRIAQQGFTKDYAVDLRKKDGSVIKTLITSVVVKDDEGNVIGFQGTIRDITERVRAEEELQQHREHLEELVEAHTAELNERVAEVEKLNRGMVNLTQDLQATNHSLKTTTARLQEVNQELNDFAYVVSHDLKAPLRGITQLAGWLAEDYGDALDTDGQEMVNLLISRTKRMHGLIEGILQYSRVGRVKEKKKNVNLNLLVQEVIKMLAPPEHIQVAVKDELPTVVEERTRLRQVFQNLVDNGIKFIDQPKGWVSVDYADEGDHWLFSVSDNGPGIKEKYHNKIFQMFQTLAPRDKAAGATEVESTGVGLALVKKIVDTWGGRVWVESTVGEGSTFYFTLPKKEGS